MDWDEVEVNNSGVSRRGAHPPCFLETAPPPYLRVWMTGLPFIWRSGSATEQTRKLTKKNEAIIQPSLVQVLQELKNLNALTLGVLGAHREKTKWKSNWLMGWSRKSLSIFIASSSHRYTWRRRTIPKDSRGSTKLRLCSKEARTRWLISFR